jgi:hypothetical protein
MDKWASSSSIDIEKVVSLCDVFQSSVLKIDVVNTNITTRVPLRRYNSV